VIDPLKAQLLVDVHVVLGGALLHEGKVKEVAVVGHVHRRLDLWYGREIV